jgi:hypothetical protein
LGELTHNRERREIFALEQKKPFKVLPLLFSKVVVSELPDWGVEKKKFEKKLSNLGRGGRISNKKILSIFFSKKLGTTRLGDRERKIFKFLFPF